MGTMRVLHKVLRRGFTALPQIKLNDTIITNLVRVDLMLVGVYKNGELLAHVTSLTECVRDGLHQAA